MKTTKNFFQCLFDEGEHTCFSKHAKGTKVFDIDDAFSSCSEWAQFFSINPLHPTKDLNPYELYHDANTPRRADKNVIVYRNILIELDTMPVDDQVKFIELTGLPYSTAVYSGGKSIHFIISLTNPIESEKEYRKIVERVYKGLGGKKVIDTSCKNPSRLSRFPNVARIDKNNTIQQLIDVKGRVSNHLLYDWLEKTAPEEIEYNRYAEMTGKEYTKNVSNSGILSGFTLNFIMMGAAKGERNSSLFRAACDMCKCGYDEEETYARLSSISGLDNNEVTRTIKSAFNKVNSEK